MPEREDTDDLELGKMFKQAKKNGFLGHVRSIDRLRKTDNILPDESALELKYDKGHRMILTSILAKCCSDLGYDDDVEAQKVSWILERERAVHALRDICSEYGDNDWDDNLSLDDVINKHLMSHFAKIASSS